MYFFIYYIFIIVIKIVQLQIEDCTEKHDCINCTLLIDCQWENNQCININKTIRRSLNNKSNRKISNTVYNLFDLGNETTKFNNLKYLYNKCYHKISPYTVEDNSLYDITSEKYCGKKNIIITNEMLINGYNIKLNNVNGTYGYPHIICQYLFLSGSNRHDVDIYINNSYKEDFLLFYTGDYKDHIQINYTSTISLHSSCYKTVSFFYYSDKTFDISPFIIRFKDYKRASYSILQYFFLAGLILLMSAIIGGIIYIRNHSKILNKKIMSYEDINEQSNDFNNNKKDSNLEVISEKKNENKNSANDIIGYDNSNNYLEQVKKKDNYDTSKSNF